MTQHHNKSEEYFSAITDNDINKVRELASSGVKQIISKMDDDHFGSYPIHVAAKLGNLEIVQCLVEHGADVHVTGNYGETPLHSAVYELHIDVARFLLTHGADIDALDDNEFSPLRAVSRYTSPEALKVLHMLLENGADENTVLTQRHMTDEPVTPVMLEEVRTWRSKMEKNLIVQDLAHKTQHLTRPAVMKV